MGKTEFVRCLFRVRSVLELNAANVEYVALSGFDASLHRCFLWDEALPKLLHAYIYHSGLLVTRLPIELSEASGPCPASSYDCCSVCATNSWCSLVEKLCEEDQAWRAANVVVCVVSVPLWEDPWDAQPRSHLQEVRDSQWT